MYQKSLILAGQILYSEVSKESVIFSCDRVEYPNVCNYSSQRATVNHI